ncbi:MAG: anti-sigma F factor [Oscillospiraceae bacterium]|nr:anti-sigma F factor [Oscillospiraceae bacterium]
MKAINEMKMNFLSRSCNESFARSAVAAFTAVLDPTVEEISDIKTAVSEAVTNCIVHGYKDGIGTVYIHVKIFEGNRISINVKDKGCGIADVKKAMEPLFTTCDTGERAGLGFSIMDSFMDKLKVRSKPGKGTSVTLEKIIVSKGK